MGNIITTLSGRSAPLTAPPTPTTPPAPTGQKRKRHPSEPETPTESRPKKRPRTPNFRLLPHDKISTFTTTRFPARNPRTLTLTLLPRDAPALHRAPVNPRHYWAPRDPVPPKPYLLENVENPSPVESECSPAELVREVMEVRRRVEGAREEWARGLRTAVVRRFERSPRSR
ncbi:hypothetical protein MBLNU230_g2230t1 [Neophaeotheca triangularis]